MPNKDLRQNVLLRTTIRLGWAGFVEEGHFLWVFKVEQKSNEQETEKLARWRAWICAGSECH